MTCAVQSFLTHLYEALECIELAHICKSVHRVAAGWRVGECHSKAKPPASLDEITNRVFEELLQGKAENLTQASDQGSVRVSPHPYPQFYKLNDFLNL